MLDNSALLRVQDSGWRNGFAPLLGKESRTWWGANRWWTRALLWVVVVNGFAAFSLFALPVMVRMNPGMSSEGLDYVAAALQSIFQIGTIGLAIGAIILAQDLIIGERESGVMEWILSKPASRPACLLSKLAANTLGMLVLMIAVPSIVGYGLLSVASAELFPIQSYLIGVAGVVIHTTFYLALTMVVGVLARSRAQVLGVTISTLLGGMLATNLLGQLALGTPWLLPTMLPYAAAGTPLPFAPAVPMIATTTLTLVLVVIALYRFAKQEF